MFRIAFFFLIAGLTIPSSAQQSGADRSVFDIPAMLVKNAQLQANIRQLFGSGEYDSAAMNCRAAIALFPDEPSNHYYLARCHAQLGRTEDALINLAQAIDRGFNDAAYLQQDKLLAQLRKSDQFPEFVKRASKAERKPSPLLARSTTPSRFDDKIAMVSESNTNWNPALVLFETSFQLPNFARLGGRPVTPVKTEVGKKVHEWYARGTCAGLKNHLYDNRDGGHSGPRLRFFPQLNRVNYCDAAKRQNLDRGLQIHFLFNTVTIGNASLAMTRKVYWRSLPRLAYTSRQSIGQLYQQYTRSHLYVYPEHEDHDLKFGDTFASNTPYLLISKGSSGSDRKLLEAVAWTLASFQPKTKKKLIQGGALMAAVQMVFRRSNKRVESVGDYLSGKAHPTVFDGKTIDEERLIDLAQGIRPDRVPPVVGLQVIEEDETDLGIDYFDDQPRVKFFDSPAAISRLLKSTSKHYRIVVSAEPSFDLNDRPLTYHWRVLRGDVDHIEIKPLNPEHSIVEIIVPHQERRPIEPGSEIMSSRVDIGAFVHNGAYYSAPGFISFHSPENEVREYNDHGNIKSVEYLPFGKQYADPFLTTPRAWTDVYQYDENQDLIGWTRTQGSSVEQFTAQGARVTKQDELGRAVQAQSVIYHRSSGPKQNSPVLMQSPGNEVFYYKYQSPDDKIGRIIKRSPAN